MEQSFSVGPYDLSPRQAALIPLQPFFARIRVAVPLIVLFLLVGGVVSGDSAKMMAITIPVVLLLLIVPVGTFLYFYSYRPSLRAVLSAPEILRDNFWAISKEGLVTSAAGRSIVIKTDSIRKIILVRRTILLMKKDGGAHVIPGKAFHLLEHHRSFVTELRLRCGEPRRS